MKKRSKKTLDLLQSYESQNITYLDPDGSWPVVWERAKGVFVWDAEGRRFLDLTAAFGVTAAGHGNSAVVKAGQQQMGRLLHAMGDVHPHAQKALLARDVSKITFERWTKRAATGKTIFTNSGFEAVEAALKTSLLATGKPEVIAFTGAYHGLGYGALNATHRPHFRAGFRQQLREFTRFLPFPSRPEEHSKLEEQLHHLLRTEFIGAILVEPIQARGGINIPPDFFLPLLRRVCDEHGAILIVDEIYTGFGRTGKWFACEHSHVVPDVICLGKALTGGFPLSACVGRADVMDLAWPESNGEAIHTSTFLGHPVGCAMALAHLKEIRRLRLVEQSARLGRWLLEALETFAQKHRDPLQIIPRGRGLMVGVELRQANGAPATQLSLSLIKTLLQAGFILLPEGEHGNVIGFTPPLTITQAQLQTALRALDQAFEELLTPST